MLQQTHGDQAADELQFYYFGLYRALKRYRVVVVIGWIVVAVGCMGIVHGWDLTRFHGLLDVGMAAFTVLAGLALVHNGVASLSAYVSIRFRRAEPGEGSSTGSHEQAVREILDMIQDIEAGGWQEAFSAMRRLREMQERYGLPALE